MHCVRAGGAIVRIQSRDMGQSSLGSTRVYEMQSRAMEYGRIRKQ